MKRFSKEKVTVVIPARYASSRFPGKPLVEIEGKPLIYHCYHSVSKSDRIDRILVATDDLRIKEAVEKFGGSAVLTSSAPQTGTDRIAEIVEKLEGDLFLNLQGDEILLHPGFLDPLIESFINRPDLQMATYKKEITIREDLLNPNIVKVVSDLNGYALYFSRSPIPYLRDSDPSLPLPRGTFYRHFGIYIYRKSVLLQYTAWPESFLERTEKLEQLRALERGVRIWVQETFQDSLRIDVPEDLKKVRDYLLKGSHG